MLGALLDPLLQALVELADLLLGLLAMGDVFGDLVDTDDLIGHDDRDARHVEVYTGTASVDDGSLVVLRLASCRILISDRFFEVLCDDEVGEQLLPKLLSSVTQHLLHGRVSSEKFALQI